MKDESHFPIFILLVVPLGLSHSPENSLDYVTASVSEAVSNVPDRDCFVLRPRNDVRTCSASFSLSSPRDCHTLLIFLYYESVIV